MKERPAELRGGSVRRLARLMETRAAGVLAGVYRSARSDAGLAFAELRPYEPGDDVRAIDWKVTARQRRPFVRVHEAERSQALWLLIDGSASMSAGAPGRTPGDVAREAALWLAAAAWHHGDRVGLVVAGDDVSVIDPRRGRGQVARVGAALDSLGFTARRDNMDNAIESIARSRRRTMVAVLGDFREVRSEGDWRLLARRHDLLPMRVVNAFEADPPRGGLIAVADPETGRQGWIDLDRGLDRDRLRDRVARLDRAFATWCQRLGVVGGRLRTDELVLTGLTRVLAERRGRRDGRRTRARVHVEEA